MAEILGVLTTLASIAVALLPLFLAVWALSRVSAMSRDMAAVRQQLAALAEHTGAPVPPMPPRAPADTRPLLIAGGVVAAAVLLFIVSYVAV